MSPPAGVAAWVDEANQLLASPGDSERLRSWQGRDSIWFCTIGNALDTRPLLDAFASYLDRVDGAARLLVILANGATPDAAERVLALARAARAAGHVELLRKTDRSLRKAAFLSADALVLLSDNPHAAIEAMAIGVPIVCTRTAAAQDLIGDAGLLWEAPTPDLFAASVAYLRDHAELRALLRARGLARWSRLARSIDRETAEAT
jgi:glycosyltransferase involved in cell wall biosynthesis